MADIIEVFGAAIQLSDTEPHCEFEPAIPGFGSISCADHPIEELDQDIRDVQGLLTWLKIIGRSPRFPDLQKRLIFGDLVIAHHTDDTFIRYLHGDITAAAILKDLEALAGLSDLVGQQRLGEILGNIIASVFLHDVSPHEATTIKGKGKFGTIIQYLNSDLSTTEFNVNLENANLIKSFTWRVNIFPSSDHKKGFIHLGSINKNNIIYTTPYIPEDHYDWSVETGHFQRFWYEIRARLMLDIAKRDSTFREPALIALGKLFHVIQDFYSHSNFIELLLLDVCREITDGSIQPSDWCAIRGLGVKETVVELGGKEAVGKLLDTLSMKVATVPTLEEMIGRKEVNAKGDTIWSSVNPWIFRNGYRPSEGVVQTLTEKIDQVRNFYGGGGARGAPDGGHSHKAGAVYGQIA